MDSLDNILYARLSSDIYCLVHNKIVELQRENKKLEEKLYDEVDISTSRLKENKDLKEKNEFLMQRDNKCQMLEQVFKKAIEYSHKQLGFLTNCVGGDTKNIHCQIDIHQIYLEILKEVE